MAFLDAYNVLKGFEGGYANNPADRGGETIFGVSSKYFPDDFKALKALHDAGLAPQADQYAQNFYKTNFWDALGADEIDPALQTIAFDTAVNSGVDTAKSLLEKSNGDPNAFLDARQAYVDQIIANDPSQAVFQEGWNNRINALRGSGMEEVTDPEILAQLNAGEEVTDAAILSQLEEVTDPELLAQLEGGQTPVQDDTLAAKEFANEHPILRTLGRTARTGAAGLSALSDLALLVPKTAALAAGLGAEKMGAEKIGRSLQELGATPSMRDTTVSIIDNATGGKLKPTGAIDRAGDFLGELISSSVPFSQSSNVQNAANAILPQKANIGTALKSVLDPETALNQLPSVQAIKSSTPFTSDTLRSAANSAYTKADELGGLLKPEATDGFLDDVAKRILPQTQAGKIVAGTDTPVAKVMERLEGLRGQPLSLTEVQEIDELLGDFIDSEFGIKGISKQGKKLLDLQNSFREMVENADETMVAGTKEGFNALKEGRKLWSKTMKMRDIERIITRAEMSDQPANAIRSGFKTLYNNEKRMRGFSKAEKELIKQAANDNLPMEILRGLASRLTGIISGATGGPAGYVAGKGVEMGARGIREAMAKQKTDALLNLISGYKPQNATPLLTNKAALAALAGAGTQGQQMLPKPQLMIGGY